MAGKDDHGFSKDNDSRIPAESDAESCVEEQAGGSWGDFKSVIAAEVKVFAVVVLALCTTSPPIGITLSAFLFLFPEYTGKHFSCLKKICLNMKSGLQYMAKRIGYAILVLTSDVNIVKEKSNSGVFELVETKFESESDTVSESSIEEIEVVEVTSRARVCFDEGSSQKTSLIEYLIVDDEKWKKIDAGDHTDDLSVTVGKKSKSKCRRKFVPTMGAEFIKKIVPKKLRKKSKKHHSSGTELEPKPISLNRLID